MRVRAACHVHSDWSYDGSWSLQQIAHAFSRRGYQVVMTTEHDRGFDETRRLEHREACRQASSRGVLLVPGIEYSDPSNCVHILVWGDIQFIGADVETGKVLDAVTRSGAVAVLAHPSRKQAWQRFQPAWANALIGIEYWNRKTDGWAPSPHAQPLIDMAGALPFVGLDFHERRQFFPLATLLDLEDSISERAVLASLSAKRCASEAFGVPLSRISTGIRARALRRAECFRRWAAPFYRKLAR